MSEVRSCFGGVGRAQILAGELNKALVVCSSCGLLHCKWVDYASNGLAYFGGDSDETEFLMIGCFPIPVCHVVVGTCVVP